MRRWVKVIIVAVLFAGLVGGAAVQTGGGYNLTWSTVDGGGLTFSTGGTYSLGGTVGQADAGTMSGGTYSLQGGFWSLPGGLIYLPLVLRQ